MGQNRTSTIDQMYVKALRVASIADEDYLLVKLGVTAEGQMYCRTHTMWVGFTEGSPKCEIRKPSVIDPHIAKKKLMSIGQPPVTVNCLEDLILFRLLGGHGIVRKKIATKYWPDICESYSCIRGGHEAGFVERGSVTVSALAKRAKKSLKGEVKVRDNNTCVLCGADGKLTLHHILFRERGGRTDKNNLITLCDGCHSELHEKARTSCDESLYCKIGVNKYGNSGAEKFREDVGRYRELMCQSFVELIT